MRSNPGFVRWLYLGALVLAGESIYMLPYMRKTFQTSMEAAFDVTATQLGTVNSMFGILALVSYFPGGWLADRLPARHLLTVSLLTTSAGGLVMLSFPGYAGLLALHAFWGVTSILTFWGALIKATRDWGGPHEQGRGFGLLDGGRGIVAAGLASVATFVFVTTGDTVEAQLRGVLWVYTLAPAGAGVLVWLVLPNRLDGGAADTDTAAGAGARPGAAELSAAVRLPEVWLLAVLILAAYWLYLGSFEFPAFSERAYGTSPEFSAVLGSVRDWLRPVAAIAAGFLADRFSSTRVTAAAFGLLVASYASLLVVPPAAGNVLVLWIQVCATAVAVFALRGIYYALMEASAIPRNLTGITVGIVSAIGFVPDTFAFVVSGAFADAAPGGAGLRAYFGVLAGVALAGLAATAAIAARRARAHSRSASMGQAARR